ncbi:hypothetical protein D3C81_2027610 [compost metagenome]
MTSSMLEACASAEASCATALAESAPQAAPASKTVFTSLFIWIPFPVSSPIDAFIQRSMIFMERADLSTICQTATLKSAANRPRLWRRCTEGPTTTSLRP